MDSIGMATLEEDRKAYNKERQSYSKLLIGLSAAAVFYSAQLKSRGLFEPQWIYIFALMFQSLSLIFGLIFQLIFTEIVGMRGEERIGLMHRFWGLETEQSHSLRTVARYRSIKGGCYLFQIIFFALSTLFFLASFFL